MNALDRLVQQALGDNHTFGLATDPAAMSWPLLWRWLTSTDAGPEHLMDPAKLSIRAMPTGFVVGLSSEGLAVSLDATCEHLADTFQALEDALKSPHPAFRSWQGKKPALRKRPKPLDR